MGVEGLVEHGAGAAFDIVEGLCEAAEGIFLDGGVIIHPAGELLFAELQGTFGEFEPFGADLFAVEVHFDFVGAKGSALGEIGQALEGE